MIKVSVVDINGHDNIYSDIPDIHQELMRIQHSGGKILALYPVIIRDNWFPRTYILYDDAKEEL